MTDKPILVGLGAHVGVERKTGITSRPNGGSKVMVFFLKYVVPSASAFQYEPDQCNNAKQTEEPSNSTANYRSNLYRTSVIITCGLNRRRYGNGSIGCGGSHGLYNHRPIILC